MIRIRHKKDECIGCKLCADTAPQYFQMDQEGLAELLHSEKKGAFHTAQGFESELEELQQCVEGCPVNIIHVDQ